MAAVEATIIADEAAPQELPVAAQNINKIPVRNLWLLMLYASQFDSNFYRELGRKKQALEDNPDEIADLVAEILCSEVRRRIRHNLSFDYRTREAVLGHVRGRINLLLTERRQLLRRGKIACRFDELTVDTPRNRYVRDALDSIARLVGHTSLKARCRSLAGTLKRMGVTGKRSALDNHAVHSFGRHDIADQRMVFAAKLAFNLALPSEVIGKQNLPLPDRTPNWVYKVYEKGIAGFYKVALEHDGWRVSAGRRLNWPVAEQSEHMLKLLPNMQTDIILEHHGKGRRIIIDTKFTTITKTNHWDDEVFSSPNLYQIYAYLRSQEGQDELAPTATGMLLYPAIDCESEEYAVIQGHRIWLATLNLAAPAAEIRERLLHLVEIMNSERTTTTSPM